MKGYLSVLGGIIHLLIELTLTLQLPLYSLPTDTQLLLSHSDSFHQTDLSLSHPPFLSLSLSLSLCLSVSPTHTPPALCPSQREHSLFPITLSQPSVYLFIHCGAGGGPCISMRVPSIPGSCQDSQEFGPCLQGRRLSAPVTLNAAHLKLLKDPWVEWAGVNNG